MSIFTLCICAHKRNLLLNARQKHPGLVMGGIENFLSRLLKDKTPRYHGILPYSDFYIFINILLRNLQNLSILSHS